MALLHGALVGQQCAIVVFSDLFFGVKYVSQCTLACLNSGPFSYITYISMRDDNKICNTMLV